jgi:hypothetical protein
VAKGVGDGEPEATTGAFLDAGALSGVRDVLTREPCRDHVHRPDGAPVDRGDVAEVRDIGPASGPDRGGVGVGLGERDVLEVGPQQSGGQVEATTTGEQ